MRSFSYCYNLKIDSLYTFFIASSLEWYYYWKQKGKHHEVVWHLIRKKQNYFEKICFPVLLAESKDGEYQNRGYKKTKHTTVLIRFEIRQYIAFEQFFVETCCFYITHLEGFRAEYLFYAKFEIQTFKLGSHTSRFLFRAWVKMFFLIVS